MPKRNDIHKVLIIGSGPIIIGQACEFDYSGTQACKALRKLGYEIVLVNSNPATIMTDTTIADKVYMEPLTLEYIAKILRYERYFMILLFVLVATRVLSGVLSTSTGWIVDRLWVFAQWGFALALKFVG